PAAWRARRRRDPVAQDRCAGQGVSDGTAADGDPGASGPRAPAAGQGRAVSQPLGTALEGGVLTLTLDRPERRNALSRSLVEALHQALERADLDAAVRVVALRRAGKDFCAGADVDELLASADTALDGNERAAPPRGRIFERIRAQAQPGVRISPG